MRHSFRHGDGIQLLENGLFRELELFELSTCTRGNQNSRVRIRLQRGGHERTRLSGLPRP